MYPPEIFFAVGGGAAGWGTLCGTLMAAGLVINMMTPLSACMTCHGNGGEQSDVISKMSCTGCHTAHDI